MAIIAWNEINKDVGKGTSEVTLFSSEKAY